MSNGHHVYSIPMPQNQPDYIRKKRYSAAVESTPSIITYDERVGKVANISPRYRTISIERRLAHLAALNAQVFSIETSVKLSFMKKIIITLTSIPIVLISFIVLLFTLFANLGYEEIAVASVIFTFITYEAYHLIVYAWQ